MEEVVGSIPTRSTMKSKVTACPANRDRVPSPSEVNGRAHFSGL